MQQGEPSIFWEETIKVWDPSIFCKLLLEAFGWKGEVGRQGSRISRANKKRKREGLRGKAKRNPSLKDWDIFRFFLQKHFYHNLHHRRRFHHHHHDDHHHHNQMKLNDYCGSTSRTKSWFEGLEADTTRSSILFRWDFSPDDDCYDDGDDDDDDDDDSGETFILLIQGVIF